MQQQARQAVIFILVVGLGAVLAVAVMAPRCPANENPSGPGTFQMNP